jgi:hypothetical protein
MMAPPPTASNNELQHAQRRTSNDSRMRWRKTVDEVEEVGGWRDKADCWWQRDNNGADNNNNKKAINK